MLGRFVIGFIAAMLAVLVFHQPIGMLCKALGLIPQYTPYNMAAHPTAAPALASMFKGFGFAGWPSLFNLLFWADFGAAYSASSTINCPAGR